MYIYHDVFRPMHSSIRCKCCKILVELMLFVSAQQWWEEKCFFYFKEATQGGKTT